jgi:aspartate/glutamate racemase
VPVGRAILPAAAFQAACSGVRPPPFCENERIRHLGLIGGLGPLATIHYYRELVNAHAGEMLVIHADMQHALAYVTRADRAGLAEYFAGLIERLAGGGAEVAAISAITPHIASANWRRFRHYRW